METFKDYDEFQGRFQMAARAFHAALSGLSPEAQRSFIDGYKARGDAGDPSLTFEFRVNGVDLPFTEVIRALIEKYDEYVRQAAAQQLRDKHEALLEALDDLRVRIEGVAT